MNKDYPAPQPQPPIIQIPDRVFKTNLRFVAPLYLTNNQWDINKSEARREELKRKRAEKEAKAIMDRKTLVTPETYSKGIDFLIDIIDDNGFVSKPNSVSTIKVDF